MFFGYEPFYQGIEPAESDYIAFKTALDKYKIPKDEHTPFKLLNKTKKDFDEACVKIVDSLRDNPDTNYVIFWLFGCHGINKNGT